MERIRLDFTHTIGDSKEGKNFLSIEELEQIKDDIQQAQEEIKKERLEKEELSFLSLPYAYKEQDGMTIFGDTLWKAKELIEQKSKLIREKASDYIQIAIGGSALGAIALFNALGDELNQVHCKIHLPDNIDPEWIGKILDSIQRERAYFNIISKSGGTVETLANFFIFYEALEKKIPAKELKEHFIITTNPEKGALAELCRQQGFTLIPIPEPIHGRFSVLSPGGLFTAAVAGIDIEALLHGALVMDKLTEEKPFWQNPLQLYAGIHYLANVQKGLDTLILIPYSQGLRTIADWYSQLIAESLGKDGKGITPVKALGVTDQHSQLQLYNEGPKNKLVTFFCIEKYRREMKIPEVFPEVRDFHYLWGHSLNELIDSEQKATAISLYNHGIPNCAIRIPKISAFYLGQLFMLLEKVICILGKLYSINAFNQPGVEESKEYARAMLGKKGERYEEKGRELAFYSDPDNLRIV